MLIQILLYFLMFDTPAVALIWFIVSLVLFLRCPAEKTDRKKNLKTMLKISSVVFVVMTLGACGVLVYFNFW
ncbi:MAG: hypothetical protein J1E40_03495 [Oscillospiraceae bacterium]|nr:hypothetical protein [Oscillospiraceae bacterium]